MTIETIKKKNGKQGLNIKYNKYSNSLINTKINMTIYMMIIKTNNTMKKKWK